MKKHEKLAYLKDADFGLFAKTRRMIFDDLSFKQGIFCCCGRLATGLHEQNCIKFNAKVDAATIAQLAHLLPVNHVTKHGH